MIQATTVCITTSHVTPYQLLILSTDYGAFNPDQSLGGGMQIARTTPQDDSESDSDPEVTAMKAKLKRSNGEWAAHTAMMQANLAQFGTEVTNYFGTLASQVTDSAKTLNQGMHELASVTERSHKMAVGNAHKAVTLAGDQHMVLSSAHESLKQGNADITKAFDKYRGVIEQQQSQLEQANKLLERQGKQVERYEQLTAAQAARLLALEKENAELKGMSSLSM